MERNNGRQIGTALGEINQSINQSSKYASKQASNQSIHQSEYYIFVDPWGEIFSLHADAEVVCWYEDGAEPEGKPFNLHTIYVPTLTYGHELWVVTKKNTSQI